MKRLITALMALLLLFSVTLLSTGCPTEQEQGPIGPQGPSGEQGPIGPQGEQGLAGPQGAPGILATTGEVTLTIPGYGLQSPGSKVIEVSHELEGIILPPCITLGLVTEYGIVMDEDFIFGFQNYLEEMIVGEDNSLPKVACAVFDITVQTFNIAAICTEQTATEITLRWWATPAQ